MKNCLLIFFFLFSGFGSVVRAQHSFLQYTVEDGLSQSSVSAITEDRQGRLWIGTQGGGISVFDGQDFIRYNTANGIPNDYINVLYSDSRGVWMGTNNGLGFFNGQRFFHITPISNKPLKILSLSFFEDRLIVGTDNGIWTPDADLKSLTQLWNHYFASDIVRDLAMLGNNLFLATHQGIGVISTDSVFRIQEAAGLLHNSVRKLNAQSNNQLLVCTDMGSQMLTIGQSGQLLFRSLDTQPANALIQSDRRTVWIGTDNGIRIQPLEDSISLPLRSNFLDDKLSVQDFYKDSWGNIWVGTLQHGLFKHLGQRFTYYNQFEQNLNPNVQNLYQHNLKIYALMVDHGVYVFENGQWNALDSVLRTQTCISIVADEDGVLWVGTEQNGIYGITQDSLWNHLTIRGYPVGSITAMEVDSNGTIWIGTQNRGIFTIEKFDTLNYDFIHFLSGRGWENTTITDFHVDLQNKLWFSTNDGRLGLIDRNGLSHIYSSGQNIPSAPIRCIIEDGFGRIILGTSGYGLLISDMYTDSIFFETPEQSPFTSLNVASLLIDKKGGVWMGTERGVEHFRMTEDRSITDYIYYGIEQGFLSLENNSDASLTDVYGDLWFGTSNGIIKYSENLALNSEFPPRLEILEVSLFNEPLTFRHDLVDTFRTTENNLSFEFRATQLNRAKDIQYQWRLIGYENSWTPLSRTTFVNYPKLPPGKYRFEVRSCIQSENCSEIKFYAFQINKPFWKTLWFIGISLISLVILIMIIVRNRFRSIRKNTERIEMENKLMELEQKALQLQMNPHFLFNALNSIQGTMSEGSIPLARSQLTKFARLMRSILTNSREDFLPLSQEIEMLEQYIQVEKFCRGHKFNYTIAIDESVDPEEIQIPSMVLQPFIENAIIHGLSKIDYPGQLKISFCVKGNILECTIIDNGIGINQSLSDKKQSKTHASLGMEVTHNRLKFMSKNKEVDRVFIRDLSESSQVGTEVKVNIPLQY